MEFMLSEALPIYSGGLGNVAGDELKTASNLGDLPPDDVRVELYAEPLNGTPAVRQAMAQSSDPAGPTGHFHYTARVPASRPASDFTPRLIPFHADASVPLEAPFILWCDR